MKRLIGFCFSLLLVLSLSATARAGTATKLECVEMAKKAAEMILQNKDAALEELSKRDGQFVWKDSYVFAMDFKGKMLAHPIMPGLTRMDTLFSVPDKNLEKPKMIFVDFVVTAATKGEGWVDYLWPKPGETSPSPKDTFIYRVPGTDILTAAGYYK